MITARWIALISLLLTSGCKVKPWEVAGSTTMTLTEPPGPVRAIIRWFVEPAHQPLGLALMVIGLIIILLRTNPRSSSP